ncbi:MAG: class I SAM-dependent methyltransferase [Myxococcales bacterium]|nr:class I SAM-dependent methyltransferase [Myxococcales bacterium]
MEQATRKHLEDLNRRFYGRHGESFSASRAGPWPSFELALAGLTRPPEQVLDLGCGNGRLLSALRGKGRRTLEYTGVDLSAELLEIAAARHPEACLLRLDLLSEPGTSGDALPSGPFDLVAALGLLHHVPGFETRQRLLRRAALRVGPGGVLWVSFWRYDRDPRFATRKRPPQSAGLEGSELERGDVILGFGQDPEALRYCHMVDDAEVERLLEPFSAWEHRAFCADGAGGRLNDHWLLTRRS